MHHTGTKRVDIKNCTLEELERLVTSLGEKPYRARQIMGWVYGNNVSQFEEMTNLPKDFRHTMAAISFLSTFKSHTVKISGDGTHKFQFKLRDENSIESVLIAEKKHRTICVSTQVGCALGCKFCLTGRGGLVRDLDSSEIINQVCIIKHNFLEKDETFNIVFMGMGEPLANYDNTLKALRILTSSAGLNITPRRITVSTAGIIPKIERMLEEAPVNLAISLNAATPSLRNMLMPLNKKYPLHELIASVKKITLPPRRRITFEYIVIRNINDSLKDAHSLTSLLKGTRCKINLIPFNEHEGSEFTAPDHNIIERFRLYLVSKHFTVTVRESKGSDISAACGQLRYMHN